ncbi:hypothetical protein OESDEN_23194, partial [Oesophagostomum dentatum]
MLGIGSRWSAIRTPHLFRCQRRRYSYALCGCCYIVALIQKLYFLPLTSKLF